MSLKEELQKMKYDLRLIDWNIKDNSVTERDYKEHLSKLEDTAYLSESMSVFRDFKEEEEEQTSEKGEEPFESDEVSGE